MKKGKLLAISLALVMVFSMLPSAFAADGNAANSGDGEYAWWDLRGATESAFSSSVSGLNDDFQGYRVMSGTYGGQEMSVTHYWSWYVESPNSTQQRIDIYVPGNANEQSPIMHMVNNSGWSSNNYQGGVRISNNPTDGVTAFTQTGGTSSQTTGSQLLESLARGYVVVSSGARNSTAADSDGARIGKSPATMTDTKAALRFVRANMAQGMALDGKGNPELAIVTGTSGGGALSTIVGSSGNSPDYFPSLNEIGALGLDYNNGSWANSISDAYQIVLAWCPMADFTMGDQAYEWFYNEKRSLITAGANKDRVLEVSNLCAAEYPAYVNALELKDEQGNLLTAVYEYDLEDPTKPGTAGGSYLDAVNGFMARGVEIAINAWATDTQSYYAADRLDALATNQYYLNSVKVNGAPYDGIPTVNPKVEISSHTEFLMGLSTGLSKNLFPYSMSGTASATSFEGGDVWTFYGTPSQTGNLTSKTAWDVYTGSHAGVGKKNTGLEWDEYLKTEEGKVHALQMKMISPMPYLNAGHLNAFPYLNGAGEYGSDYAEPATYWFTRQGLNDQQISYSMDTMLYYSLLNNSAVKSDFINFNMSWAKGHSGGYENIGPTFDYVEAAISDFYEGKTPVDPDPGTEDGYTVSIDADQKVAVGDEANFIIGVTSDEKSTFNSFDATITYDSSALEYVGISDEANYTVEPVSNGTLRITSFGEAKPVGNAFILTFKAINLTNGSDITVTRAHVDEEENANVQDAPAAAVSPDTAVVSVLGYKVTLGEHLSGPSYATPYEDYTFSALDWSHYDYTIGIDVGGTDMTIMLQNNGDGTYTLAGEYVTDPLVVTSSRTAKSYSVVFEGSGASDAEGAGTATYNSNYVFSLDQDEGYFYEVATTIGGEPFTDFGSAFGTYVIPGTGITGNIVITITKTEIVDEMVSITFEGTGAGDGPGNTTIPKNEAYTFAVNEQTGYDYSVSAMRGSDAVAIADNGDGTYTIAAADVIDDIVIIIDKELVVTVEAHEYTKLDGSSIFLVLAKGALDEGDIFVYDGNSMFYSETYEGYVYLTIEEESFTEEMANELVNIGEGTAIEIEYDGDINESDLVDINDAQLIWNMYNAKYSDFEEVTMMRFLKADMNGDFALNVLDAASVVSLN